MLLGMVALDLEAPLGSDLEITDDRHYCCVFGK